MAELFQKYAGDGGDFRPCVGGQFCGIRLYRSKESWVVWLEKLRFDLQVTGTFDALQQMPTRCVWAITVWRRMGENVSPQRYGQPSQHG